MTFEIDISCSSHLTGIDEYELERAILHALQEENVAGAVLSISVVDNETIHRLNREHLQHDYPTDVISFQLDWHCPDDDELTEPPLTPTGRSKGAMIEGDIIVSAEYAAEMAARVHWSVMNELTLYTVHGLLHICGYDDLTDSEKEIMRSRERAILKGLGLTPAYLEEGTSDPDEPPGATSPTSIAESLPAAEEGQRLMAVIQTLQSVVPAAMLASVFLLSLLCYSLRDFSRSRLEEICRQKNRLERLGEILRAHHRCLLLCELLLLTMLTLSVCVVLDSHLFGDLTFPSRQPLAVQASWYFRIAAILIAAGFAFVALPWTLSRVQGEMYLYRSWPLLNLLQTLARPIWSSSRKLDQIIHRVYGVPEPTSDSAADLLAEELLTVVDESQREGVIESLHASTMIHRVMDLQHEDVAAIMTPRTDMVTIPASRTIPEAMEEMLENGFSRVPVIRDGIDDIVGILYARDLLAVAAGRESENGHVRMVSDIARDVLYAPESQGIGDLLESMRKKKVHMAIIVDEYSGVSGLVTLEDILEEIVGDIADEYDHEETSLWKDHREGMTEVDARYHLDDLNEEFGYEFPEDEEFDTIGGFVLSCFGRIPVPGEHHDWRNLRLIVTDADERRLIRVRIEGEAARTNGVATEAAETP